jgi:hypothetical protein
LILASVLLAATLCASAAEAPAAVASAASAAMPIPYRSADAGTADLATRSVLALVVCALAGGLAIYFLRGRMQGLGKPGQARRVSVTQVQRITPKHSTVLLRWDDEELLVVIGEGHASLLARKPHAPASGDATTGPAP